MQVGYDKKRFVYSVIGLIVLFFIILFVNIIISYANLRWDLTEDKLYSLSKGTKHILSQIKVPVTIKFFYSKSSPHVPTYLKLYAKRVQEFLEEYEHASKGKVHVEVYDPKPDSDEEEWAEKYGLKPMETREGDKIYCGLVFTSADRMDKIPFLDPSEEQLLEYKITRAIYNLQHPEKKVIGIISGLPVFGDKKKGTEEWLFIKELRKTYKVKEIKKDAKKIDKDVDLLIVIYPKDIKPSLEYAIDQFILSGKNAIILVDPYCLSDTGADMLKKATLEKLFSAWGISFSPKQAVADLRQSTLIRTHGEVKDSPVIITARESSFDKSHIVTSGLDNMLFPVVGAIEKKKKKGLKLKFEPLVYSSKDSDLVSIFFVTMGTDFVRRQISPKGKKYPLVVSLTGRFKSAFPEGPPKGVSKQEKQIKEAKKTSTVIIVGDSDFICDDFYVQKTRILGFVISRIFNDNLNFLLNSCEFLTGNQDLISLRTRGRFERPFIKVLELKAKAQEKWLQKEKELEKQIEAVNRRLEELEKRKKESERFMLSPEQEKEIERFRQEKIRIQHELKEVRKKLRADIERLGLWLKFINMFLMPFLISLFGIGFALYRQKRARQGR